MTPKARTPRKKVARYPVWLNGIRCINDQQVELAVRAALRLPPITLSSSRSVSAGGE
jgi:hypothetical protein